MDVQGTKPSSSSSSCRHHQTKHGLAIFLPNLWCLSMVFPLDHLILDVSSSSAEDVCQATNHQVRRAKNRLVKPQQKFRAMDDHGCFPKHASNYGIIGLNLHRQQ